MVAPSPSQLPRDAVVLLSGGLDSMVVAGLAREQGYRLHALTIDYNQRHRIEIDAARNIAARLGAVRHVVLPLDLTQFGGSALTAEIAVPKDRPNAPIAPGIPVTYVPARNLVFLSLCLAWAEAMGTRELFIGVNALDYSGYPDCRPEFIAGFAALAKLATRAADEGGDEQLWEPWQVHAPLQHLRKADIAREAARLGLDPAWSWSCYDPQDASLGLGGPGFGGIACGACDSCRLRRAAMAETGVADATRYAVSP